MKKALIVLLILAVAGGLFAQEWGGSVTTGLLFDFSKDAKDETPIPVTGNDDDSGDAVHGSLWFEHAEDEWGVKIKTGAAISTGLTLNNAWGWINFADGLVKLSAGKMDDGVWGSGGEYDHDWSNDGILRVEIKPTDELDIGLAFSFPNWDDNEYKAGKIGNFFQQTIIGAKYTADTFFVATALKLHSEEDTSYPTDKDMDAGWYFGVGYTGIEGLEINVDGGIEYLTRMSDIGVETFWLKVAYTGIDSLTVGAKAGFGFIKSFELNGFDAGVWVEYAVSDAVSVGADVGLAANKDFAFTGYSFDAWAKYTAGNAWMKGVVGADITTKDSDDGEATKPYFKLIFGFDF